MKCREARRQLVMEETRDYAAPRRGGLARHLRTCDHCREESARLGRQASLLRAAIADLPVREGFLAGVWRRIDGDRGSGP